MKKKPTVTASWMLSALEGDNRDHVIGRALVAIDVSGKFTETDKRYVTMCASYYDANKKLGQQWVVDMWMKIEPNTGLPRIVKYHHDLDEIAKRKRTKR